MEYELKYYNHDNDGKFNITKTVDKRIDICLWELVPKKVIALPDKCNSILEIELNNSYGLQDLQELFPKSKYAITLYIYCRNDKNATGLARPAIHIYNKKNSNDSTICEAIDEITFSEYRHLVDIVSTKCPGIHIPTEEEVQRKDVTAFIKEECAHKFQGMFSPDTEDKLINKIIEELPTLTDGKHLTPDWNVLTEYVTQLIDSLILKYL